MRWETHGIVTLAVGEGVRRGLGWAPEPGLYLGLLLGGLGPNLLEGLLRLPQDPPAGSRADRWGWRDRGWPHGLPALGLLALLAHLFPHPFLRGMALGWTLHLMLDLWTPGGVQLLAPLEPTFYGVHPWPRRRLRRGSLAEGALALLGGFLGLLWLFGL